MAHVMEKYREGGRVDGVFFSWIQVPHLCPVFDPALFCVALLSESFSSMGREDDSQKSQVSVVLRACST